VPTPIVPRLESDTGQEATLGVRPEDLRIAGAADANDLCFDAAVEVVERLGSEILLDVAVGRTTMVASVEPTVTAKVHEKLRLAINPDRMHFFDNRTEAAI
jgi:multiple sugar transport system ATP-binding protein